MHNIAAVHARWLPVYGQLQDRDFHPIRSGRPIPAHQRRAKESAFSVAFALRPEAFRVAQIELVLAIRAAGNCTVDTVDDIIDAILAFLANRTAATAASHLDSHAFRFDFLWSGCSKTG